MKSSKHKKKDLLLDIQNISIEGFSDEIWHPIIKGVNLQLYRGEVLGLIGESGAGKSTLGLAAMGFVRTGCRFTSGSINFNGKDLTKLSDKKKQQLWGTKLSYVAQSAAAAFNPAHRLINQTIESSLSHKLNIKEINIYDNFLKVNDVYFYK